MSYEFSVPEFKIPEQSVPEFKIPSENSQSTSQLIGDFGLREKRINPSYISDYRSGSKPAAQRTILHYCFYLLLLLTLAFSFACKAKSAEASPEQETIVPENQYPESPVSTPDTTQAIDGKAIKYTYTWNADKDFPPVCIVIDDFGYVGGKLLQGFAELDEAVTFAVLPDLPNTALTAKTANIHGHEVILHIPMQAMDTSQSPGKTFIRTGDTPEHLTELVNNYLEQVPQALGANNHMGSRATSDLPTLRAVLQALNSKGLFFLDSKTSPNSKVLNAVNALDMEYAARDMFLDVPDVSEATLNAKLRELEKYKGRREPVIIISHCHNQAKLVAMRSFVTQLQGMGIRLIPLSEAVKGFNKPA